uniref:cofilin-1-like n=1 Tax=Pristiophorus japonicus TaxID=55135 RepID=UPI00398E8DEC
MDSGIRIHQSVVMAFDDMKIRKANQTRKKFLRLILSDDEQYIVLDNEIDHQQQTSEDGFMQLLKLLKPKSCCYIIYDVCYETKDSLVKEDLLLIQWCPTDSGIKEKFQFTATKKVLKDTLGGFKGELQLTDFSDIQRNSIAEKLGNDIMKIEGKSLN